MSTPNGTGNVVSRKNRARILAVATRVLAENPNAAVDDIAQATGLARRTVYGHFPSRDALIESVVLLAVERVGAAIDLPAPDPANDPRYLLARRILRTWPVGGVYRLLLSIGRGIDRHDELATLVDPLRQTLTTGIERGQTRGVFAPRPPAPVLAEVFESAVYALLRADCPATDAATLLLRTVGVPPDEADAAVAAAATELAADQPGELAESGT